MKIELDNIYNCDCLIGMQYIPDKSVDAIICDLPYGTTANAWDVIIPFDKLWEQYKRIRKPNAPILLFGAEPVTTAVRMSNINEYHYDWIWGKGNSVGFLHANRRPMRIFENIAIFYQDQPTLSLCLTGIVWRTFATIVMFGIRIWSRLALRATKN